MKEYIVGLVFNPELSKLVLIEKQRPDWQKGFWNGLGGSVEANETPLQAMIRECKEESGLELYEWKQIVVQLVNNVKVTYFATATDVASCARPLTDEALGFWFHNELPKVISNLYWIIPLARYQLAGGFFGEKYQF